MHKVNLVISTVIAKLKLMSMYAKRYLIMMTDK
jgi:hypothetical protein